MSNSFVRIQLPPCQTHVNQSCQLQTHVRHVAVMSVSNMSDMSQSVSNMSDMSQSSFACSQYGHRPHRRLEFLLLRLRKLRQHHPRGVLMQVCLKVCIRKTCSFRAGNQGAILSQDAYQNLVRGKFGQQPTRRAKGQSLPDRRGHCNCCYNYDRFQSRS